jgi:hypothetical protein
MQPTGNTSVHIARERQVRGELPGGAITGVKGIR